MRNYSMLLALLTSVMALQACQKPETVVERAERRDQMIEHLGTPEEKCQSKREVAEAYLEADDEDGYLRARIMADSACIDAQIN